MLRNSRSGLFYVIIVFALVLAWMALPGRTASSQALPGPSAPDLTATVAVMQTNVVGKMMTEQAAQQPAATTPQPASSEAAPSISGQDIIGFAIIAMIVIGVALIVVGVVLRRRK
jgi:hypothetical protein